MPMDRAFESLLSENYVIHFNSRIYHTDTRIFKIFDSHARDAFGKSHPQGTCVLLEVPSLQKLVQYFQLVQLVQYFCLHSILLCEVLTKHDSRSISIFKSPSEGHNGLLLLFMTLL